jgi:hypothetical protein
MERKSVNDEAGFTQAERVKELDRSRELESITVTLSSMPSKYNAFPTLPAVHSGPLINVPVFPFSEESQTVVPVPSSNFQWATRPDPSTLPLVVVVDTGTDDAPPMPTLKEPGAMGMRFEHCE